MVLIILVYSIRVIQLIQAVAIQDQFSEAGWFAFGMDEYHNPSTYFRITTFSSSNVRKKWDSSFPHSNFKLLNFNRQPRAQRIIDAFVFSTIYEWISPRNLYHHCKLRWRVYEPIKFIIISLIIFISIQSKFIGRPFIGINEIITVKSNRLPLIRHSHHHSRGWNSWNRNRQSLMSQLISNVCHLISLKLWRIKMRFFFLAGFSITIGKVIIDFFFLFWMLLLLSMTEWLTKEIEKEKTVPVDKQLQIVSKIHLWTLCSGNFLSSSQLF